jgi:hypothetical protein
MNQPVNNDAPLTPPPLPSTPEEWTIPDYLLSTEVDKEKVISDETVDDDKLKWFQMVVNGGETDLEKSEMLDAQKEQVRLGILKVQHQPAQNKQQTFGPQTNKKIEGTVIPSDILNGPSIQGVSAPRQTVQQQKKKVGPNDPCVCGSNKKFKKCCMHKQFLK